MILLGQIADVQCVNCRNDEHALACIAVSGKKVATCTDTQRLYTQLSYVRVVTITTVNTSNCPSLRKTGPLDVNHGEDLQ